MLPLLRTALCLALILDPAWAEDPPAAPEPRLVRGLTIAPVRHPGPMPPDLVRLAGRVEKLCPEETDTEVCKVSHYAIGDLKRHCPKWTDSCATIGTALSGGLDLSEQLSACAKSPCVKEKTYALAAEHRQLSRRIDKIGAEEKGRIWVWSLAFDIGPPLSMVVGASIDQDLKGLGTEIASLETKTQALEQQTAKAGAVTGEGVRSIAEKGQVLFEGFQSLSTALDHSLSAARKKDALKAKRKEANQVAKKLAQLRDRLILLQRRARVEASERLDLSKVFDPSVEKSGEKTRDLGKKDVKDLDLKRFAVDFGDKSAAGTAAGGVPAGVAGGGVPAGWDPSNSKNIDPNNHPLTNAKPKKTLLDVPGSVTTLPLLSGKLIAPPAIEKTPPAGIFETFAALRGEHGERKSVDAMRRLGLSKTVGRPGNRAGLVHEQEGNTCAVVTQQQILTAYGLVQAENPKAVEKELRDDAEKKGYFEDGTPPQYAGSLLVDHGLIITKRSDTKTADLDKVVLEGKMTIVGVDARYLWGMETYARPLGHSIVVTGAEVSKLTGEVLGYYYNDSGSDPPKGGGFITAAKFKKSFESRGGNFLEIQ